VGTLPNKGYVLEELLFVIGRKIRELVFHLTIKEERGTNPSHMLGRQTAPPRFAHTLQAIRITPALKLATFVVKLWQ
jgi:hypothetical protein